MTDRRLSGTTQDEIARALLGSAVLDEAPCDTSAKVAAAVGVSLPVALTAAGSQAASASATGGVATTSTVTVTGVAKIVLVSAALSSVGTLGAIEVAQHWPAARPSPSTMPGSSRPATSLAPATRASEPGFEPDVPGEPQVVRPPARASEADVHSSATPLRASPSAGDAITEPNGRPAAAAFPVSSPATTAPPGSTRQLEREVALLDAARRALAAGNPQRALSILDRHAHELGRGALRPESTIVRVQALLATGQRAAAERAAEPILTSTPSSRHAQSLRSLLAASPSR